MNAIVSTLLEFLPLSASMLGLVGSILSVFIELRNVGRQQNAKKRVQIKINRRKIKLDGYTEEEVLELFERALSGEKQTQTDSSEESSASKVQQ